MHVEEVDDEGRRVVRVLREPEFDTEQYSLLAALVEYEAGLGQHGLPLEETMSPLADPDNPDGKWAYVPKVRRDWYDFAVESMQKLPEWSGENFLRSRVFSAVRVER